MYCVCMISRQVKICSPWSPTPAKMRLNPCSGSTLAMQGLWAHLFPGVRQEEQYLPTLQSHRRSKMVTAAIIATLSAEFQESGTFLIHQNLHSMRRQCPPHWTSAAAQHRVRVQLPSPTGWRCWSIDVLSGGAAVTHRLLSAVEQCWNSQLSCDSRNLS